MRIVRDSQKVWPYCPDCGCRLELNDHSNTEYKLAHFGMHPDKDARGCVCNSRYRAWVIAKYRLDYIGV